MKRRETLAPAEHGHGLGLGPFSTTFRNKPLVAVKDPATVIVDLHHDRFARDEVMIAVRRKSELIEQSFDAAPR